jgi:hypothetical protein
VKLFCDLAPFAEVSQYARMAAMDPNKPENSSLPVIQPVRETVAAVPPAQEAEKAPLKAATVRLDPTRYGDWEKNGRCIDF